MYSPELPCSNKYPRIEPQTHRDMGAELQHLPGVSSRVSHEQRYDVGLMEYAGNI